MSNNQYPRGCRPGLDPRRDRGVRSPGLGEAGYNDSPPPVQGWPTTRREGGINIQYSMFSIQFSREGGGAGRAGSPGIKRVSQGGHVECRRAAQEAKHLGLIPAVGLRGQAEIPRQAPPSPRLRWTSRDDRLGETHAHEICLVRFVSHLGTFQ